MDLFGFVNNLQEGKEPVALNDEYFPFMINRALSMSSDTALIANEMNMRSNIRPEIHYQFLFHVIPKRRRYASWAKSVPSKDLEFVKKVFNCSNSKGLEILSVINTTELEKLKNEYHFEGKTRPT